MSSEQVKPAGDPIVVPVPPIGGDWKAWLRWVLIAALAVSQVVVGGTVVAISLQTTEVQKKTVTKEAVKEVVQEEMSAVKSMLSEPAKK